MTPAVSQSGPSSRRFKFPFASVLLAVAGALAGLLQLNAVRDPIPGLAAEVSGDFVLNDAAARTRTWSTEGDHGAQVGALQLGPLPSRSTLRFGVSGHPYATGNRVYLENRATGETFSPAFLPPDRFIVPIRITPPASWAGAEIYLHAIDTSPLPATWVAVWEPVTIPAWAAWFGATTSRVCAFLFVGVTLACCTLAALPLVRRLGLAAEPLSLIAALGLVAIAGYVAFWCFLASPLLGKLFTAAMLVGAVVLTCRPGARDPAGHARGWIVPAMLMLSIGLFDLAALQHHGGEAPLSALAQHRFIGNLPTDNQLPQEFARALERGGDARDYAGSEWRSSDRPPLQTGWQLLLARPAVYLRSGYNTAMQAAGLWFQLLWIPAVWAWLRGIGERPRTVAAVIGAMAASGFFFHHSVYVWPKLGCAAFVLTAFTCGLVVRADRARGRTVIPVGAAAAALGWLAHGGGAFSLLALIPWIAARARRQADPRTWLAAALGFALLALPWVAYQKFYDPPGNRLLKWHLAGAIDLDARGTLETMADAYAAQSTSELAGTRMENLRTIFRGPWPDFLRFDFSSPASRLHHEWFHTFYALGWWNLGLILTLAASVRRSSAIGRDLAAPLGWALLTLVVWIALLYLPGTAFIHHGSFATLLVLFPLGAIALWRAHPLAFGAVAIVQAASFVLVWLSRPAHLPAIPASFVAVGLMVGAATATGLVIWRADALSALPPRGGGTTTLRPSLPS